MELFKYFYCCRFKQLTATSNVIARKGERGDSYGIN